jgi:hypothetical protein
MARSEARLSVSIWNDRDFLALSPGAQRMFMFLIGQSDLAHDGVIALRERRWSKSAAGLSRADVERDLAELHDARFVVVDEDAEELLIRSFIRRDRVYRQPNVLRAAADHLPVVTSPVILATLADELRRVLTADDITDGATEIVAEMLKGIGNPSGNPSPDPSGNPSAGTPGDGKGSRNPSGMGSDPSSDKTGESDTTPEPNDIAAGPKGSGNPSGNPSRNPSRGAPGERGVVTAVTTGVSPYPVPRSPDLFAAQPDATPDPAPAARRGTRVPGDFTVTDVMRQWHRAKTPIVDIDTETANFVDHWKSKSGKDATKTDWIAAWRTWMRNAQTWKTERINSGNRSTGANRHINHRDDNPFRSTS